MDSQLNFKNGLLVLGALAYSSISYTQSDSVPLLPVKVHHIEPVYIDLVRDLGARKGEKELNIGGDFTNTKDYSEYGILAEYEFTPLDRLGLEVETDFAFYRRISDVKAIPKNKLDLLKLSVQYSFFVSPKYATTLAAGYT